MHIDMCIRHANEHAHRYAYRNVRGHAELLSTHGYAPACMQGDTLVCRHVPTQVCRHFCDCVYVLVWMAAVCPACEGGPACTCPHPSYTCLTTCSHTGASSAQERSCTHLRAYGTPSVTTKAGTLVSVARYTCPIHTSIYDILTHESVYAHTYKYLISFARLCTCQGTCSYAYTQDTLSGMHGPSNSVLDAAWRGDENEVHRLNDEGK